MQELFAARSSETPARRKRIKKEPASHHTAEAGKNNSTEEQKT